jgi:biotin/methionine sulfoxide reductase
MNSYSTAAAQVILPHIIAPWPQMELQQTTLESVVAHTELFVAFGGLPSRNAQVAYGGVTEHPHRLGSGSRAPGRRRIRQYFANCSRHRFAITANVVGTHTGTDVALMLGLAYVLETEDLAAHDFLQSHCVGYAKVKDYVLD